MICAGSFASLDAVPQIGDGMAEVGVIVLCGGNPLHEFLQALAPVAALAGGVVLGILYLLRGVRMENGMSRRARRLHPDPPR